VIQVVGFLVWWDSNTSAFRLVTLFYVSLLHIVLQVVFCKQMMYHACSKHLVVSVCRPLFPYISSGNRVMTFEAHCTLTTASVLFLFRVIIRGTALERFPRVYAEIFRWAQETVSI